MKPKIGDIISYPTCCDKDGNLTRFLVVDIPENINLKFATIREYHLYLIDHEFRFVIKTLTTPYVIILSEGS